MMPALFLLLLLGGTQAVEVTVAPGAGLQAAAYDKLVGALKKRLDGSSLGGGRLCLGHSVEGAQALATAADGCSLGMVMLGSAPFFEGEFANVKPRVLVIGGELDGVVPLSHFAVARHRAAGFEKRNFVVLRGASHMSFASGLPVDAIATVDLQPELTEDAAHSRVVELIDDFLRGGGATLAAVEKETADLAAPIIKALELEGSTALGKPACNSDYPTNPTCQYNKFPDHSLPFGPAPAPSPPLPSDCVCGSRWVSEHATPMVAGLPSPASIESKDAFHTMSDVHPFHLPHIFNECAKPDSTCVLNGTTVTEPLAKAGDLWPQDPKSAPLSVYELRTKLKSVEAVWQAANVPGTSKSLDASNKLCAHVNQAAIDWALEHAEASVSRRFKAKGEPLVIVDDKEATIGLKGPEWIKDELAINRVKDPRSPTGTSVQIQSWKFVVGNANDGSVPWFVPAGMHYCKLLSPARAMEWIYTDSMRFHAASDVLV